MSTAKPLYVTTDIAAAITENTFLTKTVSQNTANKRADKCGQSAGG